MMRKPEVPIGNSSWKGKHMKFIKAVGIILTLLPTCATLCRAQSWQQLTNQPPQDLFSNAFLLTDGTVIAQGNFGNVQVPPNWLKLTPDQNGSYVNGTWSKLAPLPAGYVPEDFASAVLADGRFVVFGGEYNYTTDTALRAFTELGAIYDPKTDTWTPLSAPNGWSNIGDAPSAVLPNGQFLLGDFVKSIQLGLLDPVTLTWTLPPSSGKTDSFAGGIDTAAGWNPSCGQRFGHSRRPKVHPLDGPMGQRGEYARKLGREQR
jgi:hypothetical protein